MRRKIVAAACAALVFAALGKASAAPVELQWWHAMTAANAEMVNKIAADFNASQSDYKIVPVFKGSYAETMNAGIAAYRAGKPPDIIQIFEVGTATMMAAKGAVKPVYQLMAEAGEPFDPNAYLPAVTGYYSTADGKMLSLPFNSSTAIAYWNKDAFKKAGLDPEKPPKTWPETFAAAKKLRAAGIPCGFTAGWISWTQIEQFSAWHNLAVRLQGRWLRRRRCRARIQQPDRRRHIANLAAAQKDKSFDYGGRTTQPEGKFLNGECGMIQTSSGAYGIFKAGAKFAFRHDRIALLPRCSGRAAELDHRRRQPLGHGRQKPRRIQGGRQVLYLSVADPAAVRLHEVTGYLPITKAAYEATKASGFYAKNPGREIPVLQMTGETADREFARAAPRQSAADPRHHRRRSRSRVRREGSGETGARRRRRARQHTAAPIRAEYTVAASDRFGIGSRWRPLDGNHDPPRATHRQSTLFFLKEERFDETCRCC